MPDHEIPAAALVQRLEPFIGAVCAAIEASVLSPCRSKRGAVVFRHSFVLSAAWNYKPSGFDCDGSESCKADCRASAIHAEQSAILRAGGDAACYADLLHVKTIDGKLVPSGGPSCAECSKLALAAGIAGVWLYHENGWHRYDAREFHRQSLAAAALRGGGSSTGETLDVTKALRKLRAEVAGIIGYAEDDIRDSIGVTNLNVLKLRLQEAYDALAAPLPADYETNPRACRQCGRSLAACFRWRGGQTHLKCCDACDHDAAPSAPSQAGERK